MADNKQAVEWLEDEKLIRRKSWVPKNAYLYAHHVFGELNCSHNDVFVAHDLLADDWEIYNG
jgi:hypothetical protein